MTTEQFEQWQRLVEQLDAAIQQEREVGIVNVSVPVPLPAPIVAVLEQEAPAAIPALVREVLELRRLLADERDHSRAMRLP